ncbi:hypothetical protein EVAR_6326_1 [Eumeta japonica]|uniref:Uncharacterized protein n=1 Tax=Eumeta variegata TaxID=151549 RepID=A0A4C1TBF6_EUMVA|nr:hypothetical protein EVAR_6326_1 [Eumeta japonica]
MTLAVPVEQVAVGNATISTEVEIIYGDVETISTPLNVEITTDEYFALKGLKGCMQDVGRRWAARPTPFQCRSALVSSQHLKLRVMPGSNSDHIDYNT